MDAEANPEGFVGTSNGVHWERSAEGEKFSLLTACFGEFWAGIFENLGYNLHYSVLTPRGTCPPALPHYLRPYARVSEN